MAAQYSGQFPRFSLLTGQTTSATPGTRTDHAHGLTDNKPLTANRSALTPVAAICITTAADNDTNNGIVAVNVVSIDDTNVTVKSTVASQTFDLLVLYED